jgi:hypothetical protein
MHSTTEGRIGHNFTICFLCVTTLECQFTEVNSSKQLKAPVQEISLVVLAFFHLQARSLFHLPICALSSKAEL